MAYVPQNVSVFIAAYSGAMTGIGAGGKVPTDPNSGDYVTLANMVGAYAKVFDTSWGTRPTNSLDLQLIEDMSEGTWFERTPVLTDPVFQLPSTYASEVLALIAMVTAADAYVTSQGIVPPSGSGLLQTATAPLTTDETIGGAATILSLTMTGTQEDSKFIISADASCFVNVPSVLTAIRLKVDGVVVPGTSRSAASADQFVAMATQFETGPLPAGSHTFDLEAECFGALALFWTVTFPVYMGANLTVQEVNA